LTGRAAAVLVFPSLSKVPTIGGVVLDDAFAPKNEPARAGWERNSGRKGEVWGAESGADKLFVLKAE
jgi:hypothetical protein